MSDRFKELSVRMSDGSHNTYAPPGSLTPNYLVRLPSFGDNSALNPSPSQAKGSQWSTNNRVTTTTDYHGMTDPSVSGFKVVKGRCETAITRMKENFNAVIDRNNQLDSILDKSGTCQQTAEQYNTQSRAFESQFWGRRWIVPIVTMSIVILLMTILCFLNRFVFWFLIACIILALISVVYFHANKRSNEQMHSSVSTEMAMAVL